MSPAPHLSMDSTELYALFKHRFVGEILPRIEAVLPRDEYSEPLYYLIDRFPLRTFRSAMPVLIAEACSVPIRSVTWFGAAAELQFFIALVQDDIVDGDRYRGDLLASHVLFGIARAALSASYAQASVEDLLAAEDSGLSEETEERIRLIMREAYRRLYRSFLDEQLTAGKVSLADDIVTRVHLDKTAQGVAAFRATALALCDGSDGSLERGLAKYAERLALAAQVKNDLYDILRYSATRGYSDIRNGYLTAVVRAVSHVSSVGTEQLSRWLADGRDEEITRAVEAHEVVAQLVGEIDAHVDRAQKYLDEIALPAEAVCYLRAWAEGNRLRETHGNNATEGRKP